MNPQPVLNMRRSWTDCSIAASTSPLNGAASCSATGIFTPFAVGFTKATGMVFVPSQPED